jgi:arsenate-mycothiol transferase
MDSTSTPNLLFLCNKNGGRSQMAAAWARSLGGDAVVVTSAGASPGTSLIQMTMGSTG